MLATELHRILVHVRWPVQSYVLAGFLFGMALARVPLDGTALLAFCSWLLLCAGLTVFNSYYDKDEEPVGGMRRPPKVTRSLLYGSLAMEAVALGLSALVNPRFLALAILTAILYFFYSHEAFRWKSIGLLAVVLNSILGFMTILAAALLTPAPFAPVVLWGGLTAALFKASVYMMMQVHQIEDDRARGDISIAVQFGRQATLRAALTAMVLAGGAATQTVYLASGGPWLPLVCGIYFGAMAVLFLFWLRRPEDRQRDLETMTRMVHLTGYLGCAMSLVVYAFVLHVGARGILG
jgi:1,4-dihydroxy-2-naphthoate octaprenyltransferase